MKIKRSRIEYGVQHQVDDWYSKEAAIIWA
jgi:hypothetical protein